jgi:hypothetical protein
MNNFQMPIYEQQNNQLLNAVMASNIKQNYPIQINEDMNMSGHKKMKKMPTKSPKEQSFTMNASMNLGNILPNLNYNGPNINNNSMNSNNFNNKKISLSSQGPKNTIPNYNQNENLNFEFNPNKMNQSGITPLLNMNINPLGNKSFNVQQNMKNGHMNNNIWNNLNNNSNNNNNHLNSSYNINNGNINDNFNGNKNIFNKKEFNKNNHNNNKNKNYQKLNNYNTHQPSNINNNNNINYNSNKNNKLIQNNMDNNINLENNNSNNHSLKKNINNNNFNNNQINNNILRGTKPQKQYLLTLRLKLDKNDPEIINIKSLKETNILLKEIQEKKKKLTENDIKLITKKINNAVEIIQKIFEFNLNRYTYKNLANINHQIIKYREKKQMEKEKVETKSNKNKSSKQLNKYLGDEMLLTMNENKKVESLNISY